MGRDLLTLLASTPLHLRRSVALIASEFAEGFAAAFEHDYVGTEHMLLGVIEEDEGVGATVLKNAGLDSGKIRRGVERLVKRGPAGARVRRRPMTPRARAVLEYAQEEARSMRHNYVGTEHLLLGLLCEQDGVAAQVLRDVPFRRLRYPHGHEHLSRIRAAILHDLRV